jgi:hypothetical protein
MVNPERGHLARKQMRAGRPQNFTRSLILLARITFRFRLQ